LFERANPPDAPRTRAIFDAVPVKRLGEPKDVAHAVSNFLDHRSGFYWSEPVCPRWHDHRHGPDLMFEAEECTATGGATQPIPKREKRKRQWK
jgi:hypothetical protein